MKSRFLRFALFTAFLFGGIRPAVSAYALRLESLSGWFSIIWGDAQDGTTAAQYYLRTDDGIQRELLIDESLAMPPGGILALNGKRITVTGDSLSAPGLDGGQAAFQVTAFSRKEAGGESLSALVSGSQPWVSIMCKFNDYADEPRNQAYFQGMYSSSWPGLDHYWREVSYNTANVAGSLAVGWYTLPQPHSYYVVNGNLNFDRAARDCTGVADPFVNFAGVAGINLMFNANLGDYAWGGTWYLTLDGVSKSWRMTWEPPWGYADITVIAHEMGHGFGLPHSSGNYGQTYDNRWDVMSNGWTDCGRATHATYGCLGQHTISHHKDILGWIPSNQKFTASGGTAEITLERLSLPQTSNYKMAWIPIGGSATRFYTVEVRQQAGYDGKLPGQAVIIHHVDLSRERPAYVVDVDGNGDTGDAGAMWTVGETFSDPANGISVYVSSATATGYQVVITTPVIPPGTFGKSSPLNGSTKHPTSLTLAWGPSANAEYYEYCYDTVNNNQCDTNWTSTTNTSAAVSGLSNGIAYYWQARAVNAGGTVYANTGAWWNFKTIMAAPNSLEPGIVTPAPAEQLLTRRPTFTWEAATGASSYTLEVSLSDTFATKALARIVYGTSYTHTLDLTANTTYFWRVRANGTYGPSSYSQVRTFRTSNPPSAPAPSSPANNALLAATTPLLKWTKSTLPAGTEFHRYEIEIASDTAFAALVVPRQPIMGIDNTQFVTPPLANGATYYWRVRALNSGADGIGGNADDQYSGWSAARSLRIAFAAPANLNVSFNPRPVFSWAPVESATSYTLQVSRNAAFTLLVFTRNIYAPATSYTHSALTPGTVYYARVRANGLYGPGMWSAILEFLAP